jgi:hypothetical protein
VTAPAVFLELARRDIRVSLAGDDRVAFEGPPDLGEADLELIRAHKATILDFLRRQGEAQPDAPEAREVERPPDPTPSLEDVVLPDLAAHAERAAILEYEAGLSRRRRSARPRKARARWHRRNPPRTRLPRGARSPRRR